MLKNTEKESAYYITYLIFVQYATHKITFIESLSLAAENVRTERQSARMSKITNDGLTRSGTGCFIAVPIWQQ